VNVSLCFLLDVPGVWTHATNWCAVLSLSLSNVSHLVSLSHTWQTLMYTLSKSRLLLILAGICSRSEWNWHIKTRFLFAVGTRNKPDLATSMMSISRHFELTLTHRKHICHFLLILKHTHCRRFGDRSITAPAEAFGSTRKKQKNHLSFSHSLCACVV